MARQPTIAEIAAEAGVSLPTVSRVLNQRPDVAPETRQRVLDVLAVRGYHKKLQASVSPVPEMILIDLVVSGWLDSEFYLEIVRGIEEVLLPEGARLRLSAMHGNEQLTHEWLAQLARTPSQGAILLSADQLPVLEKLQQLRIPLVAIDDNVPASLSVPSVGANNWVSGLTATEYLISLGHQRIAMITGPASHLVTRGRLAGYRTALESASLPFESAYIRESDFGMAQGYSQTEALLALAHPPTAIIASCDAQAQGIYCALYEHRLRAPDAMSVIGFDDIPSAQWMAPPLTTIRQPLRDIGRVASERLLQLMAGKPLETLRVELVSPLLVRASCARPA